LPAPLVTVIIPTLEGGENLSKCLAALAAQTFRDFEIIVVDNSARGVAAACVDAVASGVARVIENRENLGFGVAVNLGIEAAQGELLCTLNDDAFAEPQWLEELAAACQRDPDLGMCASQIRLTTAPQRLDSAGMQIYVDGSSKQRGRMEPAGAFARAEEVLFPSACAALYRAAMIKKIGAFDAEFFLYCEDTDLGLRARRAGFRCLYVPSAVVHHHYSGSAGRASAAKAFYVERNRLYTVIKNFPVWTWPFVPLFSLYRYAIHLWDLVAGRGLASQFRDGNEPWWKLGIILLSANYHALRKLPSLLAKRRRIAQTAVLSSWALWRLLRRHSISARDLALQP
jgi:GT2 family glycosyltransferase